jgi:hypothetical protein
MPNMQSLNDHMEGCLVKAYHQLPIAEVDIPKIVIATRFGPFEFLIIAFDQKNAVQALQRL